MTASPDHPLSPRREAFRRACVCCPSASRAALVAGHAAPSSRRQGHRLLRDPAVAAGIAARRRGAG